jgi:hypothetical protein
MRGTKEYERALKEYSIREFMKDFSGGARKRRKTRKLKKARKH